ncbi:MAG: hypothetical protein D6B28_02235 [Gammaproteobacteria bacterium]|nr:MAG: hypothetical protein D6B28_02235 [Gammaproteobacteria bacterium]
MHKADIEKVKKQIDRGSEKGSKTYQFNDNHDERKPAQWWFQHSPEGTVLFVVFYSMACRWSQCLGCNLPSQVSSRHIPFDSIMQQVDYIFALPEVMAKKGKIHKVIISNNGSILDEDTFSSTALIYFIALLNRNFKNLEVLTIETRPEYVDIEELEFIARSLAEGERKTQLEIAIGFEAFDDTIRNDVFMKGLTIDVFEKLVERVAKYDFQLKCYFMQKPVPEMTDKQAVDDICAGIDYLSKTADKHGVKINMHLNPTYVAIGTLLEPAFNEGRFIPPKLEDVARAIYSGKGKNISIFVGLSDEGLAVDGGSFLVPGCEGIVAILEQFNQTQDYELLSQCS